MSRPKSQNPRTETVLIRLTAPRKRVLEAIAHLDGVTTNAYVHGLIASHLDAIATNPHVVADMNNRAAYTTQTAATVAIRGDAASTRRAPDQETPEGGKVTGS